MKKKVTLNIRCGIWILVIQLKEVDGYIHSDLK